MKISLALTALILAVFAAVGWQRQAAVKRLREEQQTLTAEASALGLPVDEATAAGQTRRRGVARPHVDRELEAKSFAKDLIAFVKDIKENHRNTPDDNLLGQISALLDRMHQLDAGQVRILLDELRKSPDIDDEGRRNVISFAIVSLADSHPETALVIVSEAQDLLAADDGHAKRDVMAKVLGSWAAKDPLAALEWVKNNGARHPEADTNESKRALIAGTAQKDPKLAFQLIADLDVKDQAGTAAQIVKTARTPDDQREMLACLRGFAGTADLGSELGAGNLLTAFQALGVRMAAQGYDATSAWLTTAKPSTGECELIALGLNYATTEADSGKWLEWMGRNLPPDQTAGKVARLITEWTTQDYQAAGEWLASTPAGAVKNAAVASYAKTVAHYEPATAAQWAETLPNDPTREPLLRQIRDEWNRVDPAAAAAFATKHGISP